MHSFFVEIVAGLESIARTRGFGLLLCSSNEDPQRERAEIDMLRQRQVDGIVLASTNVAGNTDLLQRLGPAGIGLVMIDRDDHPDVHCDRVVTDDEAVGRLATSHLFDQGRQRVAHIAGPSIVHAKRRADGYRAALKARGIRSRPDYVVRGGFMDADGYRAMKKLLGVKPRPDAVFAANDPAAIGAMKAIWEAGLQVPEDIAIVGAGDIALGDLLRVPLTTVSWSRDELGKQAANLILERIGPEPPTTFRRVVIEPELVVRRSSGGAD
jgi:LacI family transcriptional regulator